ncbi:hypothetical protein OHA21_12645 [Actinoplanes sp. NBC_00393]|uniref:hypothetical protein n=1 Tax=Actinoplanes sp. NBC_00393 TaxID=2975953 RepID=UPI002E20CC8C
MAVDVGDPVPGWVDVLQLPEEPAQWPPAGRTGLFEVVQHRGFEVRLFPLDAGMRSRRFRRRWTGPQWAAITQRWPVDSVFEATVENVFPASREFTVRFGDCGEAVEYDGAPPLPGTPVRLVVEQQSEWTRTLILRPAPR